MFKCKIDKPEVDYMSGCVVARFIITGGNYREFFDSADTEKDYSIDVKRFRKKRSLDANSYFHVLCGKIAEKIDSSLIEVKNNMIAMYGQIELLDDESINYLIVRDSVDAGKFEELHLQATAQTKVLNGKLYRVYIVMRGSHTYNTAEMARLISGTISEAKEAGLTDAEIMTPNERLKLKEVYGID